MSEKVNLDLEKTPINKLLINYSIPSIIGMIVVSLYNAVDRMFIGNIPNEGALALSGVGVTMPIVTILLAFELLIGIGVSTNISKYLGKKNKKQAEKYLGQLVIIGGITGIFLFILLSLFKENILILFGASELNIGYAKEYLDIILVGVVFYIIGFSLIATIRSEGNPKKASFLLLTSCIINIILDPIFIFVFDLGVKGAAIATVLAQIFVFVMTIHYYTRGKSNLKLTKENCKIDLNIVKSIVISGLPIFFMQLFTSLVQIIFNNSIKVYGGEIGIGAVATVISISNILLMPVIGINQGAIPIIGFNYGANNLSRAKQALISSTIGGFVISCIGFIVILMYPKLLISLFSSNESLLEMSVVGLQIYLCMIPVAIISITGPNYFQSINKTKISIFLSLLRQVIFLVPCLLILPKYFGIIGVWMAQPVADVLATIVCTVFLYREFKEYENEEVVLQGNLIKE